MLFLEVQVINFKHLATFFVSTIDVCDKNKFGCRNNFTRTREQWFYIFV